jgi:hypothetical protein
MQSYEPRIENMQKKQQEARDALDGRIAAFVVEQKQTTEQYVTDPFVSVWMDYLKIHEDAQQVLVCYHKRKSLPESLSMSTEKRIDFLSKALGYTDSPDARYARKMWCHPIIGLIPLAELYLNVFHPVGLTQKEANLRQFDWLSLMDVDTFRSVRETLVEGQRVGVNGSFQSVPLPEETANQLFAQMALDAASLILMSPTAQSFKEKAAQAWLNVAVDYSPNLFEMYEPPIEIQHEMGQAKGECLARREHEQLVAVTAGNKTAPRRPRV